MLPFDGSISETVGSETSVIEIGTALLASKFTVTITFPLVAPTGTGVTMLVELHVVGTAMTPLNVTVLLP